MKYLLDTNICIFVIKRKPASVLAQFQQHLPDDIGISAVTLVSGNTSEFGRVPGLHVEDWTAL